MLPREDKWVVRYFDKETHSCCTKYMTSAFLGRLHMQKTCWKPWMVCHMWILCKYWWTVICRPASFLANVNVLRYVCYMLWAVRLSVCLSVVCLSVCDVGAPYSGGWTFRQFFFHHTIAQGLYFSGAKNRWWGTPLSPWHLRSKWPTPFQTAQFRPISAHSASTMIAIEKSSISTYRKPTTRFPTSHR